jgi:Golgi apparatus protein 1
MRSLTHSSTLPLQVSYLQRMGVQDFRTDMQLAEACRPDVERFCKTVEPGEGRVHNCLRESYGQLSPACR